MKQSILTLSLTLAFAAGFTTAASAATCADRAHVVSQLESRFGETLITNSVSANKNVMEIYATPGSRTWSIIITIPSRNLACLAATGKGPTELAAVVDFS